MRENGMMYGKFGSCTLSEYSKSDFSRTARSEREFVVRVMHAQCSDTSVQKLQCKCHIGIHSPSAIALETRDDRRSNADIAVNIFIYLVQQ